MGQARARQYVEIKDPRSLLQRKGYVQRAVDLE